MASGLSMLTLRPLSMVIPPEPRWGLWLSRRIVASIMDFGGSPLRGTRVEPVRAQLPDGQHIRGEWVCAPGVSRTGAAIYFVHGSGFALCSPRTHRRLVSALSKATGLAVFCVDYRLAPEHRFPAAANDVAAGWEWLTGARGIAPHQVVIVGDSAGGHLSVDLLLHEAADRRPAGLVLFSPLIDLTFTLAGARERVRRDPAIRVVDAARLVRLYTRDIAPDHPRLRLDVAGGPTLPPSLIQAGGAEMLRGDAEQLAKDIRAAGGECELQVWPDQVHVFQALPRLTRDAAAALVHAARFVTATLQAAGPQDSHPKNPANRLPDASEAPAVTVKSR
ncbi:alpha/beta hydrolase [Mycobacterium sp. pUA109]|uniref:alpha/beta hydrolase n=1 Tax=Mycobacterium sp. pUA109 TaxID=3238982 RepID=UPI00351B3DC8